MPGTAKLTHVDNVWLIRIPNEGGKAQEYRCTSEAQARALLAVLSPTPAEPK